MRSFVFVSATVLIALLAVYVNAVSYNGTRNRRPKQIPMPMLKIKIVETNKAPPKVSAKLLGKGKPLPKIMARIYHGPKAKQMFRRRYYNPVLNQQPLYYDKRKFAPNKFFTPTGGNFGMPNNQPHFRSSPAYPVKLHFTASNEIDSNDLGENSIARPQSPKGYIPSGAPQTDYIKLLGGTKNSENEFSGPLNSHPITVTSFKEETRPFNLQPQTFTLEQLNPNLPEEAKRYIEFMASSAYFLPKHTPDYRYTPSGQSQYHTNQLKYEERQPQRYIPLSRGSHDYPPVGSPVKVEFTEQDAIHSQYTPIPMKDPEIDIRGRFSASTVFGRKKEYDTRNPGNFLSEGVVKEQPQNLKRHPESDDDDEEDDDTDDLRGKIVKVPGYTVAEYCDKKCAEFSGKNIDLLCGTDRVTYYNEAQLLCIVSCTNSDIDIDYRGPCSHENH